MVSDLTASQGDFDHVMQGMDDERWDDKTSMNKSRNAPLVSQRKRSSLLLQSALDIISENEESVFETLSEMLRSEDDDILFSPPRTLDRRWSSGSIQLVAASGADGDDDHERPRKKHELALAIPARLESSFDSSIEEIVSMAPASPDDEIENATSHHSPANNNSGGGESSPDLPIQVPQRRMSPPSIFNI
ncbi:unnamed protein product [Cylindrotheca closterium]|nr:unnamed protein product [Cylindrotheca closterium]